MIMFCMYEMRVQKTKFFLPLLKTLDRMDNYSQGYFPKCLAKKEVLRLSFSKGFLVMKLAASPFLLE